MQKKNLQVIPAMTIIEFTGVKNPPALFQKIKDFNELIDHKLSDKELGYIERYDIINVELPAFLKRKTCITHGLQTLKNLIL